MNTDWNLTRYYEGDFLEILEDMGDFEALESGSRIFSYSSRILKLDCNSQTMIDALARSGLTDYLNEFFPASYDSEIARYELKFDSMKLSGYCQFLKRIIGYKLVVPDTNVLIDRILSRKIFGLLDMPDITKQVRLSRISILELEALFQKDKGQPKSRSGFCEVRVLSGLGARFFTPLPWNLVIQYSEMLRKGKKSSRLGGDPGIRKEILKNMSKVGEETVIIDKKIIRSEPPKVILVTTDFAFALASFGEDISCLHLRKKGYTERSIDYLELATLVQEYAICAKSSLILRGSSFRIEIQGFWPEKTFYDLLEGRIRFKKL